MDNSNSVRPDFTIEEDLASNGARKFDSQRGARITAAMFEQKKHRNCELCYDLNVTESTLSRWRSGGPMSVANAVAICDALDVTMDWLLTGCARTCELSDRQGDEVAGRYLATLAESEQELVLEICRSLSSAYGIPTALQEVS